MSLLLLLLGAVHVAFLYYLARDCGSVVACAEAAGDAEVKASVEQWGEGV
jgi:hypothetical protein